MKTSERALERFDNGYNCSQAVLYAFTETIGCDSNSALRIANGFGGGMGRMQEVCGAVTGGIMVLGLMHGRGINDGIERHENTYAKTRELINKFKEEFGSIQCKKLLGGCNLLSDEGQLQFKEKNLKVTCRKCVEWVANMLDTM